MSFLYECHGTLVHLGLLPFILFGSTFAVLFLFVDVQAPSCQQYHYCRVSLDCKVMQIVLYLSLCGHTASARSVLLCKSWQLSRIRGLSQAEEAIILLRVVKASHGLGFQ